MLDIAENAKESNLLKGTIVTLIFFEPSSRTFGSFGAAVKQLGGATIDIQNPQSVSSVAKGESLEDTIKTFESYSHALVMRHPTAGSAKIAADAAIIPLINAGDGGASHPTQALLDLYTIYNQFRKLTDLTVVATGDILHSRTIHSLIQGLSLYSGNTMYLLSPPQLKLSREDFNTFSKSGIKLVEIEKEEDIPQNAQVWYWNRIQKERFASHEEAEKYKDTFVLTKKLLETYGNKDMIIMDPLPRVGEIDLDVDTDTRAVYLRTQMRNGKYVRMALLALVLGKLS